MKKLLLFLIFFLPLLAVFKPYFNAGIPYTHDGENHLARFANYKIALKEGQFPPRFAPNLMNHYGYPVFNYNYPLANILSLPFSIIGISYELTFKILMITAVVIGMWGITQWLTILGMTEKRTHFWAMLAFLLSPFTVNLIFFRGGIGEMWAFVLFPWLLWLTHRIKNSQKSNLIPALIIVTLFLLSHNISVLFGGILWFVYSCFILGKEKKLWFTLIGYGLLSASMTLWFWLPAFFEKNQVIVESASLSSQFSGHFVSFSQMLFSPLQFGYSYVGPVDTLSFSLGFSAIFSLFCALCILLKKGKIPFSQRSYMWLVLSLSLILLFLQTSKSDFFWETFPLLRFIQFPWRLALYVTIFSFPLFALSFSYHSFFRRMLIALLLVQYLVVARLHPADFFHKTTLDYDLFPQSTTTANENLPQTFTYTEIGDWSPEPRILKGAGRFTVSHWIGTNRNYEITVSEKSLIAEPTMYFLGWETTVNSRKIEYANMEETQGRIGYWLEPGTYQISSRFTQNTLARKIGNTVGIIGFLVVLFLIRMEWKKSRI